MTQGGVPQVKVLEPLPRLLPHIDRFRALEPGLDREVELRILAEGALPVAHLFEAELAELERLDHSAFLPVMRSGKVGPRPYYTVPLRRHATLESLLADPGFELAARARAVRSLAGALAAAHLAGLVLGPTRLSLTAWDPERRAAYFLHHRSPGPYDLQPTLGFAPRDLQGGISQGPRADLFLWGLASYRLLAAGKLPYQGGRTLVPIRRPVPELAAEFAYAVEACLACEPELRPDGGAELLGVLDSIPEDLVAAAGAPVPAAAEESGTSSSEKVQALVLELRKQGRIPSAAPRRSMSTAIPALGPPPPTRELGSLLAVGAAVGLLAAGWLASRSLGADGPGGPGAPPASAPGLDPYVAMLAQVRAVAPADFWRLWRIASYMVKEGRLPVPGCGPDRLEAIRRRHEDDPVAACRELEGVLDELRAALAGPGRGGGG